MERERCPIAGTRAYTRAYTRADKKPKIAAGANNKQSQGRLQIGTQSCGMTRVGKPPNLLLVVGVDQPANERKVAK